MSAEETTEEVQATGTLEDGRISVEATLGSAKLSFEWDAEEGADDIDTLLASSPQIGMAVVERLLEEQAADRG